MGELPTECESTFTFLRSHQSLAHLLLQPQPLLTAAPTSVPTSSGTEKVLDKAVCVCGVYWCRERKQKAGEKGQRGAQESFAAFRRFRVLFGSVHYQRTRRLSLLCSSLLCLSRSIWGLMRARWCTSAAAVFSLLFLVRGQGGPCTCRGKNAHVPRIFVSDLGSVKISNLGSV